MDRRPYGQWEEDPDAMHRAALERARTLLRDHRPPRLDPKLEIELARILAAHATHPGASLAGIA